MEPTTVAALASGAGSLLSGLGFGSSKGPSVPSPEHQYAIAREADKWSFKQKMQLGIEHGIHPLAMLGIPATSVSPVYQSGSSGDKYDPQAIGQGINQLASSFVQPPAPVTDAKDNHLQNRLMEAQAQRAEAQAGLAQIDLINARNNLMGQPGNPPGARTSNDITAMQTLAAKQSGIPLSYFGGNNAPVEIKQEVLPPHPNKLGSAAGADQAYIEIIDDTGKRARVLNPQAVNADVEMGATLTALSKIYGVERALQITAALENAGVIGGAGAALGLGIAGAARAVKNWWNKPVQSIPAYRPDWSRKAPRRGGRND